MDYKYGNFESDQIVQTKEKMRKQIFFLLLIVDPVTCDEYDVDVNEVFQNILETFGGMNDLLNYPPEFCEVMALLNAAYLEWQSTGFKWSHYRKLVLDAGNAVMRIKEV